MWRSCALCFGSLLGTLNFFEPLGSSVSGGCGFGARHGSHHRQKQGLAMSQSEDLESRPSPYEKNKKTWIHIEIVAAPSWPTARCSKRSSRKTWNPRCGLRTTDRSRRVEIHRVWENIIFVDITDMETSIYRLPRIVLSWIMKHPCYRVLSHSYSLISAPLISWQHFWQFLVSRFNRVVFCFSTWSIASGRCFSLPLSCQELVRDVDGGAADLSNSCSKLVGPFFFVRFCPTLCLRALRSSAPVTVLDKSHAFFLSFFWL